MTDYSELVKALRYCSTTKGMVYCNVNCKYGWEERSEGCKDLLMTDAAAAIEALQKDLTTLQKCYEIADTTVDKIAKQLPKRGEWKPFDLTYGRSIYSCSVCEQATEVPVCMEKPMYAYCPNCGSQMRGEVNERD